MSDSEPSNNITQELQAGINELSEEADFVKNNIIDFLNTDFTKKGFIFVFENFINVMKQNVDIIEYTDESGLFLAQRYRRPDQTFLPLISTNLYLQVMSDVLAATAFLHTMATRRVRDISTLNEDDKKIIEIVFGETTLKILNNPYQSLRDEFDLLLQTYELEYKQLHNSQPSEDYKKFSNLLYKILVLKMLEAE